MKCRTNLDFDPNCAEIYKHNIFLLLLRVYSQVTSGIRIHSPFLTIIRARSITRKRNTSKNVLFEEFNVNKKDSSLIITPLKYHFSPILLPITAMFMYKNTHRIIWSNSNIVYMFGIYENDMERLDISINFSSNINSFNHLL